VTLQVVERQNVLLNWIACPPQGSDPPQPTGLKPAPLLDTFPLVLVLAPFSAYYPTHCEKVLLSAYDGATTRVPPERHAIAGHR